MYLTACKLLLFMFGIKDSNKKPLAFVSIPDGIGIFVQTYNSFCFL